MPRVKRGTKRRARRKKILDRASGYFLTKSKLYRSAKEFGGARIKVRLTPDAARKTSVPFHLDCAYRRCCPPEWNELQPVDQWMKKSGVELDRKILLNWRSKDPEGFSSLRRRPSRRWAGCIGVFAADFFTDDHRLPGKRVAQPSSLCSGQGEVAYVSSPQNNDFSPAALERAVADLLRALENEWSGSL